MFVNEFLNETGKITWKSMLIDEFILIKEIVKQRDKNIKIFKERREWKRRDQLITNQRSKLDRHSLHRRIS